MLAGPHTPVFVWTFGLCAPQKNEPVKTLFVLIVEVPLLAIVLVTLRLVGKETFFFHVT